MSLILRAIMSSAMKLASTIILAIVVLFIFAAVGQQAFRGQYQWTEDSIVKCSETDDFSDCLLAHIYTFGEPARFIDAPTFREFLFACVYNLSVVFLLTGIIVGVITDSFAYLRQLAEDTAEAQRNTCYVCGHARAELEDACPVGFLGHTKREHNKWNFINFMLHVDAKVKKHQHLSGMETYFMQMQAANDLESVWPVNRALCIDGNTQGLSAVAQNSARLDEIALLCAGMAQRQNALSVSISMLTKLADLEASALLHAAARGDVPQTQGLIERGVDINSVDYDMRSALHVAAAEGHEQLVSFLLTNGADATIKDRWGRTPADEAKRSATHLVHLFKQGQDNLSPLAKTTQLKSASRLGERTGGVRSTVSTPSLARTAKLSVRRAQVAQSGGTDGSNSRVQSQSLGHGKLATTRPGGQ